MTTIPVTKTFLPPMQEYTAYLERAWSRQWITNRGELVIELERKLKEHLDLPFLTLTNNGTIPLQIAIKALELKGEIITTPFSYVATTASIVWENCTPVFVDIDADHLTIDENLIEAAISPNTSAIMATHVFGNPCNVEAIEAIAKKYGIRVIYDAAHAFGVKYKGKSLFAYGDVSTCSFHATKLFHTGEGGAMITQDPELHHKLFYSHNFGHNGPLDFHGLGINGKMSELQGAMGLAVLPYLMDIISQRRDIIEYYRQELSGCPIVEIKQREHTEWNYSYFPVIFPDEIAVLRIQEEMNREHIIPRRYFYPSLNNVPYVSRASMPHSESIASRILCLPLFVGLLREEQDRVIRIIRQNLG